MSDLRALYERHGGTAPTGGLPLDGAKTPLFTGGPAAPLVSCVLFGTEETL